MMSVTSIPMLQRTRMQFQTLGPEPIGNAVVLDLIERAREARAFSYAPYSDYNVGCAILARSISGWFDFTGTERKIFQGTNIENAAYSPTMCAERAAIFSAVSAGFRSLLAIAVVGDRNDNSLVTPCGVCRQVMVEFGNPNTLIIMAKNDDTVVFRILAEMLPEAFGPANLGKNPEDYEAKK